ncbi:hypothetical protein FN846DRAFT_886018 [Sphaerosporella brunnea]|uniref:Uncharacterized protein n=1 Tax=Sphaerosporella brunnea TaxID=1250544 RepID=A0A5J5FBS6_9PEZI|nr:hypothetical protein FN846DRAFT_886018 [Sphaerosporella brunnea]
MSMGRVRVTLSLITALRTPTNPSTTQNPQTVDNIGKQRPVTNTHICDLLAKRNPTLPQLREKMPDTATRARKRTRNTEEVEASQKPVKSARLPLYKNHNRITWGADVMRKLVKTVTAQLNTDPKRKKVISTVAVEALVHRLCLDNVRNIKAAKQKTMGDSNDKEFRHFGDGECSVNATDAEIDKQLSNQVTDTPTDDSDCQTPLAEAHHHEMRLPPCQPVQAKYNDETRSMNSGLEFRSGEVNPVPKPLSPVETLHPPCQPVRAQYIEETRRMNGGLESGSGEVNPAPKPLARHIQHASRFEPSTTMRPNHWHRSKRLILHASRMNSDLESQSFELNSAPNAPCQPVRVLYHDETRSMNSGLECRLGEVNLAPKPLSPIETPHTPCQPVRAQYNHESRSMNSGLESRSFELNPAPKRLSPVESPHPPPCQPVRARYNDAPKPLAPVETPHPPCQPVRAQYNNETRSRTSGIESRFIEPDPAPKLLPPVATVCDLHAAMRL